jgi:hypothetical protein
LYALIRGINLFHAHNGSGHHGSTTRKGIRKHILTDLLLWAGSHDGNATA